MFKKFKKMMKKIREDPFRTETAISEMEDIGDVLTTEQSYEALKFYKNDHERIKEMMKGTKWAIPPTTGEDKNDPRLWLSTHWKWFLNKIYYNGKE